MIYHSRSSAFQRYNTVLPITISQASSESDIKEICQLQITSFDVSRSLFLKFGFEQFVRLVTIGLQNSVCLMAKTWEGIYVGSIDISFHKSMHELTKKACDDMSPVCASFTTVMVKNEYQRKRVAYRLLDRGLTLAINAGMRKAVLDVERTNTAAISCYMDKGFVMTDHMVDSMIVMVKELL